MLIRWLGIRAIVQTLGSVCCRCRTSNLAQSFLTALEKLQWARDHSIIRVHFGGKLHRNQGASNDVEGGWPGLREVMHTNYTSIDWKFYLSISSCHTLYSACQHALSHWSKKITRQDVNQKELAASLITLIAAERKNITETIYFQLLVKKGNDRSERPEAEIKLWRPINEKWEPRAYPKSFSHLWSPRSKLNPPPNCPMHIGPILLLITIQVTSWW